MRIDNPSQCQFHYRLEVPGVGEVGGQWDLRKCIRKYLGDYDFAGKRVLDAGTASGFLTFEMEKLGAEVVSFDMEADWEWDVVPQKFVRTNPEAYMKQIREDHRRLKNAYWFTHQRLGSKAKAYYGDIYNLPKGLGRFHAAVMGMVISHFRDPFRAIYNVAQLCDRHLIITNQVFKGKDAVACFAPTLENQVERVWWIFTEECIRRMLSVMGFKVIRTVVSKPICLAYGKPEENHCVAFVAERVEA
jgi:tRNA A58 N-methylase Trm61